MTLQEKQQALLADLIAERAATDPLNTVWLIRLDKKIVDMQEAIHGSGTGLEQAGNTSVQDVPRGDAQTL